MLYFGRGFLPIQYSNLLPRTFRLANALGYGVGSMFMIAGGVLVILKMAKREDDPEVALHQKVGDLSCARHLALGLLTGSAASRA